MHFPNGETVVVQWTEKCTELWWPFNPGTFQAAEELAGKQDLVVIFSRLMNLQVRAQPP